MKGKVLAAVIVLLLVLGGIYLFSRPQTSPPTPAPVKTTEERAQILIREDSYQRGDPDAAVTVVEFVDFQCEACTYMHPITQKILDEYKGKVKLVVRYWPLDQHKNAKAAVYAAEAAGELDKYWEMYDKLMISRQEWSEANSFFDVFAVRFAKDLGLDGFPTDFQTAAGKFSAKIERDKKDASTLKTKGVPNFFINGVDYGYIKSYEEFKQNLEKELALCDRTTLTEDDIDNGRLLCTKK